MIQSVDDVSFAWTNFEIEAIAACEQTLYGKVVAPMARAKDLVILKAMSYARCRPSVVTRSNKLTFM